MKDQIDFKKIIDIINKLSLEENFLIITEEYTKGGFFKNLLKQHLRLETLDVVTVSILEEFEYKDLIKHSNGKDKFKLLNDEVDLNTLSSFLEETNISKCLIHSSENFYTNVDFLFNHLNIPTTFIKSL